MYVCMYVFMSLHSDLWRYHWLSHRQSFQHKHYAQYMCVCVCVCVCVCISACIYLCVFVCVCVYVCVFVYLVKISTHRPWSTILSPDLEISCRNTLAIAQSTSLPLTLSKDPLSGRNKSLCLLQSNAQHSSSSSSGMILARVPTVDNTYMCI